MTDGQMTLKDIMDHHSGKARKSNGFDKRKEIRRRKEDINLRYLEQGVCMICKKVMMTINATGMHG